jgi:hypothetical protein
MKQQNYFLTLFVGAVLACAAGCSEDSGAPSGGTGGSSSTGGAGGGGNTVPLVPTDTGWVDKASNSLGVQGAWYAYADSLGDNAMPPGNCQTKGGHSDAECSKVESPAAGSFTNTGGMMCTKGTVEVVLAADYSNMWGAGIGLDFNNSGGDTPVKGAFDASSVAGVSFVLTRKPLAGLRVEFPQTATEGSADGNDYADASSTYPVSMLTEGANTVMFDRVKGPKGHVFNPADLLGVQFHVPTTTTAASSFDYCISDLTLIKK